MTLLEWLDSQKHQMWKMLSEHRRLCYDSNDHQTGFCHGYTAALDDLRKKFDIEDLENVKVREE